MVKSIPRQYFGSVTHRKQSRKSFPYFRICQQRQASISKSESRIYSHRSVNNLELMKIQSSFHLSNLKIYMLNRSFKFFRGVINRGHERWHCSGAVYRTVARAKKWVDFKRRDLWRNHQQQPHICKQQTTLSVLLQVSTHLKIIKLLNKFLIINFCFIKINF